MNFTFESVSVEHALSVVASLNGLAKSVRSSNNDFRCWLYLLHQISFPSHYRPVKSLDAGVDRGRYFNPETQTWHTRNLEGRIRGASKNTLFTKKLSTTLLARDGYTRLFRHGIGESVGILFDRNDCRIKGKYIFSESMNTDERPWLKHRDLAEDKHRLLKSTPLSTLQKQIDEQRSQGLIPEANEILAGLNRKAMIGIYATKDTLRDRVAALAMQGFVFHLLNKELPLFIITPEQGIEIYDKEQQKLDIETASNQPSLHAAKEYLHIYQNYFKSSSLSNVPKKVETPHRSKPDEKLYPSVNDAPMYKPHQEVASRDVSVRRIVHKRHMVEVLKKDKDLSPELLRLINEYVHLHLEDEDYLRLMHKVIRFGDADTYSKVFHGRSELYKKIYEVITFSQDIHQVSGDHDYYERTKVARSNRLSPMTIAALLNEPLLNQLIEDHPEQLNQTLYEINKLRPYVEKYYPGKTYWDIIGDVKINPEHLRNVQLKLLLSLEQQKPGLPSLDRFPKQLYSYRFSYQDKRLLEEHHITQISQLKTSKEAMAYYHRHIHSTPINYHRKFLGSFFCASNLNPKYDRSDAPTKTRQRIVCALIAKGLPKIGDNARTEPNYSNLYYRR